MQRLLEQAGLAEEGEDLYNSFSAYSQGQVPDMGMEFVLEVPKSYWEEKEGMAHQGYGDMRESIFQKGMRGWGLPDYGTGLSSGY